MIEIEHGEIGEGYRWEYHAPYHQTTYGDLGQANQLPCPHASFVAEVVAKTRPDGSVHGYERAYEVPEVAVCFNEAHHNSTALCLRCADEARKAAETTR